MTISPISFFFIMYTVFLVIAWIVMGGISTARARWDFGHEWVVNWEVFTIIPTVALEAHIPEKTNELRNTTWIDFRFNWLFFEFAFGIVDPEE